MKRIFLLCIACCFLSALSAQSTRKIRELENKRKELHQQIAESETLLQSTKKDVKSQLENLALLTGQIEERRRYIHTIETDVNTLAKEITTLQRQLTALQRDLKEKKKKYEASVQYMYRNKSVQEKLMFIFSAENLSQTYRRMRYVQEYANYQRLQGLEIERRCKRNIKSNDSYSSVVDADSEKGLTERTFYNAGLCELPYLYALVHPGTSVNVYVDSEDDYDVVKNMAYLPQNLNIYHKDR